MGIQSLHLSGDETKRYNKAIEGDFLPMSAYELLIEVPLEV
jgi:hypothetical protein